MNRSVGDGSIMANMFAMWWQRTVDLSAYTALRLTVAVVQALPLRLCAQAAELLATLCTRWLGIRRQVIDDNLRTAYPQLTSTERRRIAWQMWRHLFLMIHSSQKTTLALHSSWKVTPLH